MSGRVYRPPHAMRIPTARTSSGDRMRDCLAPTRDSLQVGARIGARQFVQAVRPHSQPWSKASMRTRCSVSRFCIPAPFARTPDYPTPPGPCARLPEPAAHRGAACSACALPKTLLLRDWVNSVPPRRSPQHAAPPPARPPPLGGSSQPRSRDRSSGRTGFDRGGASPA